MKLMQEVQGWKRRRGGTIVYHMYTILSSLEEGLNKECGKPSTIYGTHKIWYTNVNIHTHMSYLS